MQPSCLLPLLLAALPLATSLSQGFISPFHSTSATRPELVLTSKRKLGLAGNLVLSSFRGAFQTRRSPLSGLSMSTLQSNVLIVGGGPSGLAAGLELNKIINEEDNGFPKSNITIVESMPSITSLDTEKAFSYLVSGPGLNFVDRHELREVENQGVKGSDIYFTIVEGANGTIRKNPLPFIDKTSRPGYWHPREKFIKILVDTFNAKAEERNKVGSDVNLELLQGWELSKLDRTTSSNGNKLEVLIQSCSDRQEQRELNPWLVVGADGLKSTVRERLSQWAQQDGRTAAERERFEMHKVRSASAGLRYKVISRAARRCLPLSNANTLCLQLLTPDP